MRNFTPRRSEYPTDSADHFLSGIHTLAGVTFLILFLFAQPSLPETKPSAPPPPISTPYSRPPSTVSSPSRLGRRLSSQLPSTDVVPGIGSALVELGQGNASAERSLHGRGSAARDRGVGGCQVFGIVHEAVRMLLPSAPRGVASVTPPAVRATVCPLSKTEDSRDRTRAGMTPGAVVPRSGTSMPPGRRSTIRAEFPGQPLPGTRRGPASSQGCSCAHPGTAKRPPPGQAAGSTTTASTSRSIWLRAIRRDVLKMPSSNSSNSTSRT